MSSRLPWVPPSPGGAATRSPPKVRFKDTPPGSREATFMYNQLRGEINRFYIKAALEAQRFSGEFRSRNMEREGLKLRYMVVNGQEIVEVSVSDELFEQFQKQAAEICWDWMLMEVHLAEDPYAAAVEFYAVRTIPAPAEQGIDNLCRVYDPSTEPADAVDGLEPPVTSYPGPVTTPDIVEHTSEDGLRVSSLVVDLRRFGGGGTSVDLYARVPSGNRTRQELAGWAHLLEPGFPVATILIETDALITSVVGVALPTVTGPGPGDAELPWVTSPTSLMPGGTTSDQIVTDVNTSTTVGESFVNTVTVGAAPAAPVTIFEDAFDFAAQEALGPFSSFTFQAHQVLDVTYHSPSGLVETITHTEARWKTYASATPGNDVEVRTTTRRWTVDEYFGPVPYPFPLAIDAEIRLAPGFGEPPFDAVKVTGDDGTDQGSIHTRWAILTEGEGEEAVRFIGTYKTADVTLETTEDWKLVGTLVIFPCEQAASFGVA